jgi:hypothetical protein
MFSGDSDAVVTPGVVSSITSFGQLIGENSTGLAVFGLGATSSTGLDTLNRVEVTLIGQANFVLSDLAPPSINARVSGISIYRDSGSADDRLDRGDLPVNLTSIGRTGNTYLLNFSSELVPLSQTGSFTWLVLVRTSTTIGNLDAFQVRIGTNGVVYSGGVTTPSSSRTTDTITCNRYSAVGFGTGTLPIGESSARVSKREVVALSMFSPIANTLTIEGFDLSLTNISGLKGSDLLSGGGISYYIDDGTGSADVWDPAGDTLVMPRSYSYVDYAGFTKVTLDFYQSGANAHYLPTSVSGLYGGFLVVSSSSTIGHLDIFNVSLQKWGIRIRGSDSTVKGSLPYKVSSATIKADTRAPSLSGADLQATSDLPAYFMDYDTDLSGTDSVFVNSLTGYGSGQLVRVRFRSYTEDFPDSLKGEPAFNMRPNGPVDDTDSNDQTVSYTIYESGQVDDPVTFTLTDKVGHTTTWDVRFTIDNAKPQIDTMSILDGSQYIHADQALRKVYFRTLMSFPENFHITGTASDPSGGAGLSRLDYSFETDLYSSPSTDSTPDSFNGSYGVSASSRSTDGTITMQFYDKVGNRALVEVYYQRVTADPTILILRPSQAGINVSGIYLVKANVTTPGPIKDVSFSSDGGSTYQPMSYDGPAGGGLHYIAQWDTMKLPEGTAPLRYRVRDQMGGADYDLTWVNVDNYPLTGTLSSPLGGSSVSGTVPIDLTVSSFCTSVKFTLDDATLLTRNAPFTNGRIASNLNTTQFKDGIHTFKAILSGFGSESLTLQASITIDNAAPVLTSLQAIFPKGKEAANIGDLVRITARISDATSGLKEFYASASSIGGKTKEPFYDDGAHGDGSSGDGLYGTAQITVDAAWAYHRIDIRVWDRAMNKVNQTLLVPVDPNPPLIEDSWIDYPGEHTAARSGDAIQVMARVSDSTAPMYVTMVLDDSGSMSDKMADLKAAAQTFVNATRDIDYIAIYTFITSDIGQGPVRILDFTQMNNSGKEWARSRIQGLVAFAATPIWDTIGAAVNYTLNNAKSYPVVLAFTDGADDSFLDYNFEEGSSSYCPWHDWGSIATYSKHLGKYYVPGSGNLWIHNYFTPSQTRSGLLNAPLPIYTIGLGLEHHDPPNKPQIDTEPSSLSSNEAAYCSVGVESGTTEYNLWRIATTSAGGVYTYAPSETQLSVIFRNIAASIFTTENPSKIISVKASLPPGGVKEVMLYDDGLHNDGLPDDGLYASDPTAAPSSLETWIDDAFLQAKDWALNIGMGDAEFILDNQPAVVKDITIAYPPNSTSVADGQILHVSLNATDQHSGILRVTADGSSFGVLSAVPFSDDGIGNDQYADDSFYTSSNMTPATGNSEAGFRFLDVTVIDGAGNPTPVRVQILIVNDRLAPFLIMMHPGDFPFLSGSDTVRAFVRDDGKMEIVRFTLRDAAGKVLRQGLLLDSGGGMYECPVDVSALQEKLYVFDVTATDTAGRINTTGNLTIGVDNSYPTFRLIEPRNNSGISGVAIFKYSVNETFLDGIYCRVDGGEPLNVAGGLNTNNYEEGPHEVYVYARDRSGKVKGDRLTLYFDNSDPTVDKIAPVDNQILSAGDDFLLRCFDGGGISTVRVMLYDWGGRVKPSPPFALEEPRYVQLLKGPDIPGTIIAADYTGELPNVSVIDGQYLLVAQVTDRSGRTTSNYSRVIVDNEGPSIDIRTPGEGARIEGGFVPDISVTEDNLVDDYILFRGSKYARGDAIDLMGVPEGAYVLRVVAIDALGHITTVDREVFVDSTPPRIDIATPGDGATLTGELSIIAWIGDGSGIMSTSLIVDGYEIASGVMLSADGLYSFRLDLGPFNMSAHTFRIKATDRAGLIGLSEERMFLNERYDTDGDGVLDPYDDAPKDPRRSGDYDGDGFGTLYDSDDDGDGVLDNFEADGDSLYADGTRKGVPFSLDPDEWMDSDMDGIGNNADPDDDGDGIPDGIDMFPLNSTESGDVDSDGIGDNDDPDIDGDGVLNEDDDLPYDPEEWRDTDGDGVGDNADDDDDGDGVVDSRDDFPKDRRRQYFWEPVLLVLFIVLLCSLVLFTGMVFRTQISDAFDRSWAEGRLYRWKAALGRRFSKDEVEEEDEAGRKPPQRGRPAPKRPFSPTRPRASPTARGPAKRPSAEESFGDEKVGSHNVRWSPK